MKPWAELVVPAIRWDADRGFQPATRAIEDALALGVGGFILFGGERDAARALTRNLQAATPHPLLIAADLERGAGQQVRGLTGLPPLMALAELGETAVREAARVTALEGGDVGINWVLAPVVDLDLEPANPIVQTRSFGADEREVAQLAVGWIESCQAEGTLACAKHFPGHGRTTADSHAELPVVGADRRELGADLFPFRRTVEAGVASIMTAHVAYPALDGSGAPATYSSAIVTGLLREEMGYDGLVVTDALIMEGARAGVSAAEGAVRAVAAGCDLLLYPKDARGVAAALEAAAAGGTLGASRLEAAVARRRAAASRAAAIASRGAAGSVRAERAARFAEESLRPLRGEVTAVRAPVAVEIVDDDAVAGAPYPMPARAAFTKALWAAGVDLLPSGNRLVLLFADVKSWKGRSGLSDVSKQRLAHLLERPATVVLFGHPRRLDDIPGDGPVLCAWSGDEVMQRAAARRLVAG